MNDRVAKEVLQRMRVPSRRKAPARPLCTAEMLRMVRFWGGPDWDSLGFRDMRVCELSGPTFGGVEPPKSMEHPHRGTTVSALALNEDVGILASGGWDRRIRLWRLEGADGAFVKVGELPGHQGVILGLRWGLTKDDTAFLVSCSNDGRVICWKVCLSDRQQGAGELTAEAVWSWKGQDAGGQVTSITCQQTPDGNWLLSAVKQNGLVMLWDRDIWRARTDAGQVELVESEGSATLEGGSVSLRSPDAIVKAPFVLGVRTAVLMPGGDGILIAGNDKTFKGSVLRLPISRDTSNLTSRLAGDPVHMEARHQGGVRCMTVSECGRYGISGAFGSKNNLLVHDVITGKLERVLEGHGSGVAAMGLKGQYLLTAHDNGDLRIWRWIVATCVRVLQAEAPIRLRSVEFSVDGKQIRVIGATEKTKTEHGRLLLWA